MKATQWAPRETGQVVILDNRDSFVLNLAHRLVELGADVCVVRSDQVDSAEVEELRPAAVVISPGPDHPDQAGCSVEVIRRFGGRVPILGVCLGHQAIARAFGGAVAPGGRPRHGVASVITHDGTGVFQGLPNPLEAARYHSLVVTEVPECLEVTARAEGFVMGLRHREWPLEGVQFHPESVLTPKGYGLLENFLALRGC